MLDALRTGEDEVPPSRLTAEEVAEIARMLDMTPTPLNALALSWALGRGEFGPLVVVARS